ncbi:unnamed protein product [Chrysoparadoxa australica]
MLYLVPLLLCSTVSGFVFPSHSLQPRRSAGPLASRHAPVRRISLAMATKEEAMEQARKLEALAADLRAEATAMETEQNQLKLQAVKSQFETLDVDGNGVIDVQELVQGLEPILREKLKGNLKKRLGTSPTPSQVNEAISELPGATLITTETAEELLSQFDTNKDGVLQLNEFDSLEVFRQRFERIVAEQADAARESARVEREQKVAQELAQEMYDALEINNDPATGVDRVLSTLPYILPLLDAVTFGSHFVQTHENIPFLTPLFLAAVIFRAIPFSGISLFFGFQFIASNPKINKLVRYNLRQAVNLDILVALPALLSSIALVASGGGQGGEGNVELFNTGSDVLFFLALGAIAYSVGASLLGQFPNKLPILGAMNPENPDKDGPGLM